MAIRTPHSTALLLLGSADSTSTITRITSEDEAVHWGGGKGTSRADQEENLDGMRAGQRVAPGNQPGLCAAVRRNRLPRPRQRCTDVHRRPGNSTFSRISPHAGCMDVFASPHRRFAFHFSAPSPRSCDTDPGTPADRLEILRQLFFVRSRSTRGASVSDFVGKPSHITKRRE
jgi:hypothetical protein